MMTLLNGHSLVTGECFQPERLALQLSERGSTATMTLREDSPVLSVDDWLMIEDGPGSGIVWRVKTIDTQYDTKTRTVTLEHTINSLRDKLMFGEVKSSDISGSSANPTAQQAIEYILARQSDWTLGGIDYSVSNPYSFNGDDLFSAMEIVTNSLEDSIWEYDFSSYPFKIYIKELSDTVVSEMRTDRNIRTLRKTIDRSRMYTRFYPIGKNNLHIDGNYVSRNENLYGTISKTETDQSKKTKAELLAWANERISRHCEPFVTVTISGLELEEVTGESLDSFTIGKICRVPLPEFSTTITERVTKLNYADVINEPMVVTVTLANELQDVASILKQQSSSSGRGGRTSALEAEEDHAWFVDTTDHVSMVAEAVAGKDEEGNPNWSRVSELTVDGNGIDARVTQAEGDIVTNQAAILMTQSSITQYVDNNLSDVHSSIVTTAEQIRSEVHSSNSTLYSYVNQTSTYIQSVVEDVNQDLHSEILQTQSMIRSAVWTANSTVFAYVDQTASYILDHVGERSGSKVMTGDTPPVDDPENPLNVGDLWIEGTMLNVWDDMEGEPWVDYDPTHPEYDWSQLKGQKVYTWKDGKWNLVLDETVVAEDTALLRTKEAVSLIAYNQKVQDGEWRANVARLDVKADKISSTVDERVQQIGSSIEQTARQIRAEVHSSNSQIYSVIEQTSSYILTHVEDEVNDIGSEILQTARQIRAEVHASQSNLYSYVDQTATYIRSEVASVESGIRSSITQTASQIRSEVNDKIGQVNSSITQTASQIRIEVSNTTSSIYSSIKTNADNIELKVSKNGVISSINQTSESITINAGRINLEGYVKATDITSDFINTKVSNIATLTGQGATFTGNVKASGGFTVIGSSSAQGAQTHDLTYSIVDKMIKTASVSSNTLTLTRFDGTSINFSKATTLSGNWGGDTLTITASPQGNNYSIGFTGSPTVKLGITTNGSASKHETLSAIVVPMKVCSIVGDNWTSRYTENITVTATNLSAGNIKKNVVIFGVTGTYEGTSRTDKGSGWYCTIEQSGSNKNCRLSKTFSASQNVPFSNGSSYHLYT